MRQHSYVLVFTYVAIAVLVSSCSKDDPTAPLPLPPPPSTAGSWFGSIVEGTNVASIQLNLSQDIVLINGVGSLSGLELSVSGQNSYPGVTLLFSSPGYEPFTFAGQFVSLKKLTGIINGSGFIDATVILNRN